jgi:hypothetical protein
LAYDAEISRANPGCILFMIDRSGSMEDPFFGTIEGSTGGGQKPTKAQGVADAINRLLSTIVIRCTKEEGARDYFDVGVLGYGEAVAPAFSGPLAGRPLVKISEVADNPARVETRTRRIPDGAGGLVEEQVNFPVWFDAVNKGGTPMTAAFRRAHEILQEWVTQHPTSFPPILVHLTDGESTDGDPTGPAQAVQALSTGNGSALVFNCHMSSERAPKVLFPGEADDLPQAKFAPLLFGISSQLPPGLADAARAEQLTASSQPRGFVFNGDLVDVIRFLDIGTRTTAQLR